MDKGTKKVQSHLGFTGRKISKCVRRHLWMTPKSVGNKSTVNVRIPNVRLSSVRISDVRFVNLEPNVRFRIFRAKLDRFIYNKKIYIKQSSLVNRTL